MFNIDESEVIVGNGAAELINVLGHNLSGKMAVSIPAFNEYVRCFKNCELIKIDAKENNYQFNIEQLFDIIDNIDIITIINPDNPSGSFINYNDIMKLIEKADTMNKIIIIDESFIDFADETERYTLLNSKILQKYKNLIIIKSISKSYGIPGIRLGVLASGNKQLLNNLREDMPVWNINSYAEYFLQIATLYLKDYTKTCNKISEERRELYNNLKNIKYLNPYKSEANYIMCEVIDEDSTDLANYLIKNYNILIKDLKNKKGFENKNYIRLAVKTKNENYELIEALKKYKEK